MEDVEAIRREYDEESFLFVVDSAQRNEAAYPSPGQYTIEFDAPFERVFGFELLNATIPRTEYVIDVQNNTLQYEIGGVRYSTTIEPGDYNLIQLCDAMNAAFAGRLTIEPHSTPYQLRSRARILGNDAFTVYQNSTSTLPKTLGFYGGSSSHTSTYTGTRTARVFEGPSPGIDSVIAIDRYRSVRQPFVPYVAGTPSSVLVQVLDATSNATVRILDADGIVYGTATVSGDAPETTLANALPLVADETYYIEVAGLVGGQYVNTPLDAEPACEIWEPSTASLPTWAIHSLGVENWFGNSLVWSEDLGLLITINNGEPGYYLTSTDGIEWTQRSYPDTTTYWQTIAWISSIEKFVAAGNLNINNDIVTMFSSDGVQWTTTPTDIASRRTPIAIADAFGKIVLITDDSSTYVSSDGIAWQRAGNIPIPLNTQARAWSQERGILVVSSYQGIAYTTDGALTWTSVSSVHGIDFDTVAWSSERGLFVAMADAGIVATSPDGIAWTTSTRPGGQRIRSVAWSPSYGMFVGVGEYSPPIYSTDGLLWVEGDAFAVPEAVWMIAWCPGLNAFVASGSYSIVSTPPARVWTPHPDGLSVACDLYAAVPTYELEGPGLVDLTGERHVIVHCDEIESHMYHSLKTERFHGGLGMVRLGNNGFQDQRFDFVSFPSRRLSSPIAKLKSLTFRLTKSDGTPYNTRGVDHTLLCVIKYYTKHAKHTSPTLLNREYTSDPLRYQQHQWQREIHRRDLDRIYGARQPRP